MLKVRFSKDGSEILEKNCDVLINRGSLFIISFLIFFYKNLYYFFIEYLPTIPNNLELNNIEFLKKLIEELKILLSDYFEEVREHT